MKADRDVQTVGCLQCQITTQEVKTIMSTKNAQCNQTEIKQSDKKRFQAHKSKNLSTDVSRQE